MDLRNVPVGDMDEAAILQYFLQQRLVLKAKLVNVNAIIENMGGPADDDAVAVLQPQQRRPARKIAILQRKKGPSRVDSVRNVMVKSAPRAWTVPAMIAALLADGVALPEDRKLRDSSVRVVLMRGEERGEYEKIETNEGTAWRAKVSQKGAA
jgi:hypothetical protein